MLGYCRALTRINPTGKRRDLPNGIDRADSRRRLTAGHTATMPLFDSGIPIFPSSTVNSICILFSHDNSVSPVMYVNSCSET